MVFDVVFLEVVIQRSVKQTVGSYQSIDVFFLAEVVYDEPEELVWQAEEKHSEST